jgi:hypothetical protein
MATVAAVEGEIERHGESLSHDAGHGARYAQGKIILRKEDHQALQSLYAFNISPNVAWGIPELTRSSRSSTGIPIGAWPSVSADRS